MNDLILTRHVAAALLAAWQSKTTTTSLFASDREAAVYLAGVRDVISVVALFFRISPGSVMPATNETRRVHDGRT